MPSLTNEKDNVAVQDKRILVISHNCFGDSNNMGRTLKTMFSPFAPSQIAQLYFGDETPDFNVCNAYFRVTDLEMLKSIFLRKSYGATVVKQANQSTLNKKPSLLKNKIVKIARYRTPAIYCTRNILWNMGKWDSNALKQFVDEFQPDVVFYASGDYAFSYKIALKIAETRCIPLIIGCYDDFYLNTKRTISPVYICNRWYFMHWVKRTFIYASGFTAICDLMTEVYKQLFKKPGRTLYTATNYTSLPIKKNASIVYTGNLGYGRAAQLVAMGRALKSLRLPDYPSIDVYSAEIRPEITNQLTKKNGIRFHGLVTAEKVREIICSARLVIHTESFEVEYQNRVRYSISTKIADCLACGTCIFAFGPQSIASISYLQSNAVAYVVTERDKLALGFQEILSNSNLQTEIIEHAKKLAKENHDTASNAILVRKIFDGEVWS